MPTISRNEADLLFVNYRKDEHQSALSLFPVEDIQFSRPPKGLEALVNVLNGSHEVAAMG